MKYVTFPSYYLHNPYWLLAGVVLARVCDVSESRWYLMRVGDVSESRESGVSESRESGVSESSKSRESGVIEIRWC